MAWIKRNLFFVISLAVGLILTGYCTFLLLQDLDANTQANSDYQSTIQQLTDIHNRNPYPSAENIAKAKEDLKEVGQFVADARKIYGAFPTPPKVTEEGFSSYLETTVTDLTLKATNAGVRLPVGPPTFSFGFTDQRGKLKFDTDNIPLWMQQWQEIKAICEILYSAKINSLTGLQRVPVSGTDAQSFATAADMLQAGTVTNSMAVVTPYKITFKSFSRELADVLTGFAKSSNCFMIKNLVVYPAGPRTADMQQTPDPGANSPLPGGGRPRPEPPSFRPGTSREQMQSLMQGYNARLQAWEKEQGAAATRPAAVSAAGPPVTVLREQLLLITLSVEVVKIKAP